MSNFTLLHCQIFSGHSFYSLGCRIEVYDAELAATLDLFVESGDLAKAGSNGLKIARLAYFRRKAQGCLIVLWL